MTTKELAKPKKWVIELIRKVLDLVLSAIEENACDDAIRDEVFNIVSSYLSAYATTFDSYKESALKSINDKAIGDIEKVVSSAREFVNFYKVD